MSTAILYSKREDENNRKRKRKELVGCHSGRSSTCDTGRTSRVRILLQCESIPIVFRLVRAAANLPARQDDASVQRTAQETTGVNSENGLTLHTRYVLIVFYYLKKFY